MKTTFQNLPLAQEVCLLKTTLVVSTTLMCIIAQVCEPTEPAVPCMNNNFTHYPRCIGLYKLDLPFIPGRDGAGVVEVVGEGVTEVQVGDRVAHVMQPSYAEYTVAPVSKVVKLPNTYVEVT
jgi:hypothetical protein